MSRTTRIVVALAAIALLATLAGCGSESSDGTSPGSPATTTTAVDVSEVKRDLRTLANEFETYYVDNQRYPLAMAQEGASVALVGDDTTSVGAVVVTEGVTFTKSADVDDATGYCITATAHGLEPIAYDSMHGGMTLACGATAPTPTASYDQETNDDEPAPTGPEAVKYDLRTIANELETYFVDHARYPKKVSRTDGVVVVAGTAVPVVSSATFSGGRDGEDAYCVVATTPDGDSLAYDSDAGGITGRCD